MQTNEDDNPNEHIAFQTSETTIERYREVQSERIRRGMGASAAMGFYISHTAPHGYRKVAVDGYGRRRITLELDPPASETVRTIFDRRLQGNQASDIATELNGSGIAAPSGGTWNRSKVQRILRNEVYCGTNLWGRRDPDTEVRVPNAFPAIVSQDEFDRVQRMQ